MKQQVYSLLVNNNAGVLSRVAGLFSRRGYSIDSITTGSVPGTHYARMTIVSTGDESVLSQIELQVRNLEDVIEVLVLKDGESVVRDLIMIKLNVPADRRAEVVAVADVFRANVVDIGVGTMILELTGTQNKVEGFLNLLSDY